MVKTKQRLFLEFLTVFCCLVVIIISASTMAETQSKAQVLGLIAGSFGAGAAFVSAIRDYEVHRREGR